MHLGEIIGMAESKGYFYRFPAETRKRNSWIVSMKSDGRMHTEYSCLSTSTITMLIT